MKEKENFILILYPNQTISEYYYIK